MRRAPCSTPVAVAQRMRWRPKALPKSGATQGTTALWQRPSAEAPASPSAAPAHRPKPRKASRFPLDPRPTPVRRFRESGLEWICFENFFHRPDRANSKAEDCMLDATRSMYVRGIAANTTKAVLRMQDARTLPLFRSTLTRTGRRVLTHPSQRHRAAFT